MAALMAEPWFGPDRSPRWGRRLLAGVLLTVGALLGAILCRVGLWIPMLLSCLVVAIVTIDLERLRGAAAAHQ